MDDITPDAAVIGIDTHKDVHVAIAINGLGARLATESFPVTSEGYRRVVKWAAGHGNVHAFGIEGTGSYGAGLARALAAKGLRVIEVGRVNRQLRRRHGTTDTVEAESAARAVLAGDADGEPKFGDGTVEMIRHLQIARDTALKARAQACRTRWTRHSCVDALEEALARFGRPEIFNTDQGSQFTRTDFTDVLREAEVWISMDGRSWMENGFGGR